MVSAGVRYISAHACVDPSDHSYEALPRLLFHCMYWNNLMMRRSYLIKLRNRKCLRDIPCATTRLCFLCQGL